MYTVDCDVVNTGIPYSDAFTVKSVYCLTYVSKKECRLRVSGCVKYKKTVWGIVKCKYFILYFILINIPFKYCLSDFSLFYPYCTAGILGKLCTSSFAVQILNNISFYSQCIYFYVAHAEVPSFNVGYQ